MSKELMEGMITGSFTWSALMLLWMLRNMLPRIEIWDWRGLVQDISVVGFVSTIAFFCVSISLRRWFDLPQTVTAVAVLVMAIALTPLAWHVHEKAGGRR